MSKLYAISSRNWRLSDCDGQYDRLLIERSEGFRKNKSIVSRNHLEVFLRSFSKHDTTAIFFLLSIQSVVKQSIVLLILKTKLSDKTDSENHISFKP